MKRKQVWQYSCDFCKKKKLSASAMSTHEKHCTMNPNRFCRMCDKNENATQRPLAELIALLPSRQILTATKVEQAEAIKWGCQWEYTHDAEKIVNAALPALREATDNCPACIMAAIRQAGINIPIASDFHFAEEVKTFWDKINEENADHPCREYM
jgi:hypothetical protein